MRINSAFQKAICLLIVAGLQVATLGLQAETKEGENILVNPGFEEALKGWYLGSSGEQIELCEVEPHSGAGCVSLKKSTGEGPNVHVSQAIKGLKAGSKIICSAWLKTDGPDTKCQIYCDIKASTDENEEEWFSAPGSEMVQDEGREWRKVEFSFVYPEDQQDKNGRFLRIKHCWLRLALRSSGEAWFDDVSVIVAPTETK